MIRDIIRGCRNLPYLGSHPGTFWVEFFILAGGIAGAKSGWQGFIAGIFLMAMFLLPVYFWSAYERTKLSDKISLNGKSDADQIESPD